MRFVTYTLGFSGVRLGLVVDGLVVDVERLGASRGLVWPGDVVEAGVDGVGVIRHPVVAI